MSELNHAIVVFLVSIVIGHIVARIIGINK